MRAVAEMLQNRPRPRPERRPDQRPSWTGLNLDPPGAPKKTRKNCFLCRTFDHLRTSKVAYFKRKYAEEEEDLPPTTTTYLHRRLVLSEDRGCILALSLEKLRFPVDPEVFLRRSVLIHNLLRKIHLEPPPCERPDPHTRVQGPDHSASPGLNPDLDQDLSRKRLRRALRDFQPHTVLVYDNG